MTNSEVCKLLGLTPRTLQNLQKDKNPEYFRVENQYNYKVYDFKYFIEKFRVEKLKIHKAWKM